MKVFLREMVVAAAVGAACAAQTATPAKSGQGQTQAGAEDAKLKAIYTAEAAWRRAQRGESDDENDTRILPVLPHVDAATQAAKLTHWEGVMRQLDGVRITGLSTGEVVN